jgi:16S rRNA (uracil1498-N3)-methyltransferase
VADLDAASGTASLSAEETHHVTHVLRLRAGDEIAVFDGAGREYRARIDRVERAVARLTLLAAVAPPPEPAVRLTLAQAILKSDRMDDVVRDATMMGVAAIEPLMTAHGVVRPTALRTGRPVERWRRIVLASAKQCGRAVLPDVGSGAAVLDWIARDDSAMRLMLVEPSAAREGQPLAALGHVPRPPSATIMVGPEGGWADDEIDAAIAAGWRALTLGRRTLRADAVPIIAIGVLLALWDDL